MGSTVLADGQFGPQIILRPFSGFEAVYQGAPIGTPIMFTEYVTGTSRDALDPQAGNPGYSPRLLRGISVPQGARVQILLPSVLTTPLNGGSLYNWQLVWRMRNPGDAAKLEGQQNWHFPKQANGVTDTRAVIGGSRVLIPAAYETILYPESEPTTSTGRSTGNLRIEQISPRADTLPLPLLPDGNDGEYQQGVFDPQNPSFGVYAPYPSYNSYFTNAKGDELLLGVTRAGTIGTWDFTAAAADEFLALLFGAGSPADVGVYVAFGSSP